MRRRFIHLGCLVILLPVLPFYALRIALQAGIDGIDWLVEDRAWSRALVCATDWFESRFEKANEIRAGH